MIENLKRYRQEFGGSRVPMFLMNKQQLQHHRQALKQSQQLGSAGDLNIAQKKLKSTSLDNFDDHNEESIASVMHGVDNDPLASIT